VALFEKAACFVVGFLDLWLVDHVTSSDQRIGDFLRARAQS
jgi:hemerythrin